MRFKRLAGDPLAWVALIITPVALVILWDLSIEFFKIPSFLMPPPHEVRASIVQNRQALFVHGQVTLAETLIGFGLSVAIGIPIAMLIVSSRLLDRILNPILVASQAVPKVALAPLLLVLLGYGAAPKIIVALLIAFFLLSEHRERAASRQPGHDQADALHARVALANLHKSSLSDSRPAYPGRIRVAIAFAVVGAVVGEFVGSRTGLGYLMLSATGNFDTALVFACVIVLTALGIALFYSISPMELALARFNRLSRTQQPDEGFGAYGM